MPNITITTIDNGSVVLEGGKFRDETLLFVAANGVSYTRADDSNYTVAASTAAGMVLQVGNYTVTAGTLAAGIGKWTAVAPNGATETCTTTAAAGDLNFPGLGLLLDVTAASSVWDTGDVITVNVAEVDTWAAGTILARQLVSNTIAVAYTRAAETPSDYTVAASAVAGRTLRTGAYTVTAGTLTNGVGPWTAVAPNGDTDTCTTTVATGDLTFPELGLFLDVTAVSAVFETGDVITATVAAQTGTPLVPFASTGVNGAQTPVAVLVSPVSCTLGGSLAARVLVSGEVNKNRLIIDADGNGSNVTDVVMDALCSQGIIPTAVEQLSRLDNGAF